MPVPMVMTEANIGSVDFAGGNVVHISSGVSALLLCILLGKRYDYARTNYRIHNVPFVAMGAFILLFGWFGFNAGSALAADGLAAHAFITTAVSSAAGMLSWMLCDVIADKKPTFVGASTGLVAGLVGIHRVLDLFRFVQRDMKQGNYYSAAEQFLYYVDHYYDEGIDDDESNENIALSGRYPSCR